MTTITQDPGNHRTPAPSIPGGPGAPGTLTAVPHADQPRTAQKDAPAVPPGAPRPATLRPTPLGELAALLGTDVTASAPAEITGITHDSRAVRPGDVYAALPGARLHGADFAAQAAGL
ncbi:Mur ligase domain-containing protein, partial [Streptomyces sp. 12297]